MKFKGWTLEKTNKTNPYKVQFWSNKKLIYIGNFPTEEAAVKAYQENRPLYPSMKSAGGKRYTTYGEARCPVCGDYKKLTHKFITHVTACERKYDVEGQGYVEKVVAMLETAASK